MKQNFSPETERQWQADVNLREALRRRYADEAPLPDDFARKLQERIVAEQKKLRPMSLPTHRWRNVAAVLIGMLVVSGLVYAAVRWSVRPMPHEEERTGGDSVAALRTEEAESGVVQFRNVSLDSILSVVGSHYRKAVVFVDEEPRTLRFSIAWDEAQPLSAFLATVNEFDGLRLTDERDTLFVESEEDLEANAQNALGEEDEP